MNVTVNIRGTSSDANAIIAARLEPVLVAALATLAAEDVPVTFRQVDFTGDIFNGELTGNLNIRRVTLK